MPFQRTLGEHIDNYIKLENFLKTRRNDQTREYAKLILEELREGKEVNIRDVLNKLVPIHIPTEGTFFRVLKDLSDPEWDILKRREDTKAIRRGRAPVFYKLKITLPWPKGQTDDRVVARRYAELAIAKDLLREAGVSDPDAAIKKRFDEMYGVKILPNDEEETEQELKIHKRGIKLDRGISQAIPDRGIPVKQNQIINKTTPRKSEKPMKKMMK